MCAAAGSAIAYQVHGSGDHDLLNGSAAANVDSTWDFPEAVRVFRRLGRFARVIHFDPRDTGSRDSGPTEPRWRRTCRMRWP